MATVPLRVNQGGGPPPRPRRTGSSIRPARSSWEIGRRKWFVRFVRLLSMITLLAVVLGAALIGWAAVAALSQALFIVLLGYLLAVWLVLFLFNDHLDSVQKKFEEIIDGHLQDYQGKFANNTKDNLEIHDSAMQIRDALLGLGVANYFLDVILEREYQSIAGLIDKLDSVIEASALMYVRVKLKMSNSSSGLITKIEKGLPLTGDERRFLLGDDAFARWSNLAYRSYLLDILIRDSLRDHQAQRLATYQAEITGLVNAFEKAAKAYTGDPRFGPAIITRKFWVVYLNLDYAEGGRKIAIVVGIGFFAFYLSKVADPTSPDYRGKWKDNSAVETYSAGDGVEPYSWESPLIQGETPPARPRRSAEEERREVNDALRRRFPLPAY